MTIAFYAADSSDVMALNSNEGFSQGECEQMSQVCRLGSKQQN